MPRKKKKSQSLKKWFIISPLLFLLTLIVLTILFVSPQQVKDFYFYTLNPKAGAVKLEQEYRKNFNGADIAMQNANLAIDDEQSKAKTTNEVEIADDKIRGYFSDREASFTEMIRIDNQALKLNLPNDYKVFYKKRLTADNNDFAAFKVYYSGEVNMMDATTAMSRFQDSYTAAYTQFNTFTNGFNPSDATKLNYLVQQVNTDYQTLAGMSDTGDLFTQGILTYLQRQYDFINLFRQLSDAAVTNDSQKSNEVMGKFINEANQPAPDIYVLMSEWYKDKLVPVQLKQDAMHKKSWDLYKETYLYAKNQNINGLLKVWGNTTPGDSIENAKPGAYSTSTFLQTSPFSLFKIISLDVKNNEKGSSYVFSKSAFA